jgi:DNA-binding CsgD family transcriptional regulator
VGGAVYFMITFVTPNIAQIITVFLPPVSMFFLLRSKRGTLRWERKVVRVSLRERPPFRLIGISLFFGASFGIMKGLFVFNEGDLFELRYLLNMAAIALGSIAIYISMNTFHMDFDHLTYQIALPLMAAGFIFLPLHDPFNIIGTAVHQFGYQYFYIVLWALWPVLARRGDVPGAWIVCWGLASIQSGQLIGSIFSAQLIGIISSNFELAMVSSCAIFVILFIALFALGNTSTSTGWGFLKPIEETDQTTPFERICMQTVRANGLSSREAEVFFMLAKGHNRAHISEKLFVSDETVKTHIKHIYRKVGVHSQQELIDTIEANEQTSR